MMKRASSLAALTAVAAVVGACGKGGRESAFAVCETLKKEVSVEKALIGEALDVVRAYEAKLESADDLSDADAKAYVEALNKLLRVPFAHRIKDTVEPLPARIEQRARAQQACVDIERIVRESRDRR